jgi:hypothetical protein
LFLSVAGTAVDFFQLLGVRNLLDLAVAGYATEGGMRGRLQGGRIETRGNSRLPLPGARPGIVAAGAVLGAQLRRLLAAEACRQHDRNGSEPE